MKSQIDETGFFEKFNLSESSIKSTSNVLLCKAITTHTMTFAAFILGYTAAKLPKKFEGITKLLGERKEYNAIIDKSLNSNEVEVNRKINFKKLVVAPVELIKGGRDRRRPLRELLRFDKSIMWEEYYSTVPIIENSKIQSELITIDAERLLSYSDAYYKYDSIRKLIKGIEEINPTQSTGLIALLRTTLRWKEQKWVKFIPRCNGTIERIRYYHKSSIERMIIEKEGL